MCIRDRLSAQLVQEVRALIADLLVQPRNRHSRLPTIATAIDLAAERLLRTPEFARLGTIPAWVLDCFTTRHHRQRLQADVNADVRQHWASNLRRNRLLHHQADEPMSARLALECRTLRHSFKWAVQDDRDPTDFGN